MSRFSIRDPFYERIRRGMDEERMARILAVPVRYGCFAAGADAPPIVDRDPGDEDDGERKEGR
jgi:hypothetical protein